MAVRQGILVGLVVVLAATTGAQADVLCKRRNGTVVIRTACKKKEAAVDLGQFGVVGPQGPPGPPGGFADALPSGKTLTGYAVLAGGTPNAIAADAISFPIPVSTDVLVEIVHDGDAPHLDCPGGFRGPRHSPDTCASTRPRGRPSSAA